MRQGDLLKLHSKLGQFLFVALGEFVAVGLVYGAGDHSVFAKRVALCLEDVVCSILESIFVIIPLPVVVDIYFAKHLLCHRHLIGFLFCNSNSYRGLELDPFAQVRFHDFVNCAVDCLLVDAPSIQCISAIARNGPHYLREDILSNFVAVVLRKNPLDIVVHIFEMFRSEKICFTKMEESIVGDPVGLKAVQSIMQTATQSNLSFFHKAGTMSKSLSPSVQQLLDLSKSPTCRMFIRLNSEILSKDVIYLRIINIVESFSITQPGDEEFWIQLGAAMNLFEPNRDFPYQLDIQFDVKQLIKRNIRLVDIVDKISTLTSVYNKTIVYSPSILGIIRIYCDEHQSMIKIINKLHLGIEGIHDATFQDALTIITSGSNLHDILKIGEVDIKNTYTNHLLQMEETFGIEAARDILYDEILLKNNNPQYAGIIADYMCVSGVLKPFSKDSTMIRNPILSMGYEEASSDLKKMHTNTVVDPLQNSYSRMALGLPMDQGFEIIFSENDNGDV